MNLSRQEMIYADIFYRTLSHRLTKRKRYKDLFPYENALYKLFSLANVRLGDNNYIDYVPMCIDFVKNHGDCLHYIDNELIGFLLHNRGTVPTFYYKELMAIFKPEVYASNKLSDYLCAIYAIFVDHEYDFKDYKFSYEKFNNFYDHYLDYRGDDKGNPIIIAALLAYIYLNNLDDYSMVNEYVKNHEYYDEKLELNGLRIKKYGSTAFYTESFHVFYENINTFFNDPVNQLIK